MSTNVHRRLLSLPPTSPSLRDGMPHVFVFPPEEEQMVNPPWCCFNASEHLHPDYDDADDDDDDEHPSDAQYIDVALDFIRDTEENSDATPVLRRASVDEAREEIIVPRKGEKRSSSVISFISYRNDGEGRQHGARELPEDIVEVVKVRRNEGKVDASTAIQNPATKKSKSIKLPFQKAFRSIKNVGKSSSSRKPHAKEVWTSSRSTPNVPTRGAATPQQEEIQPPLPPAPPRAPSPLLTRRASRRISQLFSRSNYSNVNLISVPPSEPKPTPEPAPAPEPLPERPPSLVISTAQSSSLPYLRDTDTSPSVDDLGVPTTPASADINSPLTERPISPSLSSTSRKSSRRFSVMDLHRLFTFSSSPSIPVEDLDQDSNETPRPSQDTVPSLPPLVTSNDAISTTSSTSSYNYPPITFSSLENQPNDNTGRSKTQWRTQEEQQHWSSDKPAELPRDISVEMRLDSMHFDSLSFDPEDFDMSLAMDGRRRL